MVREKPDIVRMREARQIIERLRDRLLRPSFECLPECASDLGLAVECIHGLDAKSPIWQGVQRKALEAEVIGLRRDVRCVEALLANAAKFYAGWARLLSPDPAPPNYTSGGSIGSAPMEAGKLVIHG